MPKLAGKVAVVTGGNSGIGLATAKLFRSEGARVAISGRNPQTLQDAAKAIGGDVIAIRADVSKIDEITMLFRFVAQTWDGIDILFANAGIGSFLPVADVTEAHFDEIITINVRGLFFTVQKAIPYLKPGSAIVLNASVADEIGLPGASVYSASKAAVRSFARTMTAELADQGIRVNVVSPGPCADSDPASQWPLSRKHESDNACSHLTRTNETSWDAGRGGECGSLSGEFRLILRRGGRTIRGWRDGPSLRCAKSDHLVVERSQLLRAMETIRRLASREIKGKVLAIVSSRRKLAVDHP